MPPILTIGKQCVSYLWSWEALGLTVKFKRSTLLERSVRETPYICLGFLGDINDCFPKDSATTTTPDLTTISAGAVCSEIVEVEEFAWSLLVKWNWLLVEHLVLPHHCWLRRPRGGAGQGDVLPLHHVVVIL